MSSRPSTWTTKVGAVLLKDIRSELRTRYSLNALLMFSLTTLIVVSFSLGRLNLNTELLAALYWIIIFFSAMSALAGVFSREEDSGTAETLRLFARPSVVYTGKLLYNISLLLLLCLLITPLFIVFMNVGQVDWPLLLLVTVLGVIGLAGATTIIGAIVSKAGVRGALFAVLSFPLLLPLLILAIGATRAAFGSGGWGEAADELQLLIAYAIVMITVSSVLFDYVWNG